MRVNVYHAGMHAVRNNAAYLAYVTAPAQDEALALARALVEEGLAAGVNVIPGARSVYRWRGAVREAGECLLLAQVSGAALPAFTRAVRERHGYEVPCIVALTIADGHEPFLRWIAENSLPPSR
ncbi:divalent-cation tolerance protein CutA [uncultured Desulfovibrio sp.]|uniref:divalent-cation tolerance protein CutA n=1 Tax=uncultured Desulfovibrio sp. TaxID=167968 RepID=UPI00261BE108|nr:divalent-cation tolerance protein CutA [uncultured Desulfovibrio sp.]